MRRAFTFACLGLLAVAAVAPHATGAPLAYVSNEGSGTISVIDTATDKVAATITTGGKPRGIALSLDGKSVTLTSGEFSLLRVFAQHPRQPLAREKLMVLARGRDHELFDRAIDVQVSRLRKLVEPDPANPRYIQTVWGFGYVYMPDSSQPGEAAEVIPGGNAS